MYEYAMRNIVLADMGYTSYEEYLKSKLWVRIRKKVLAKTQGKCSVCRDPANEVHHTSYDRKTLEGKNLKRLRPLCRSCHDIGEFNTEGKKMTLHQANQRLELYEKPNLKPSTKTTEITTTCIECGKHKNYIIRKRCSKCHKKFINKRRLRRNRKNRRKKKQEAHTNSGAPLS